MRERRKFALCHPDRLHHSKGLCPACSQRFHKALRNGLPPEDGLAAIVEGSPARSAALAAGRQLDIKRKTSTEVTYEIASRMFVYNPETGILYWSGDLAHPSRVGFAAGTPQPRGYLAVEIYRRPYKVHRIAWLLTHGVWPAGVIDHRDGDTANNRIGNLRDSTQSQNGANSRTPRSNRSGFKGVSIHGQSGKWRAAITVRGRRVSLGLYKNPEDAAAAYIRAAKEAFGEYARAA